MDTKPFEQALSQWRTIVGDTNVSTAIVDLANAQMTTFQTTQRVPAIVRPADATQVQRCMQVANAHGIPVYPSSRGRNAGYGSRVPYRDGSVVFDLGRMNRIVAFDEDLCYVTVEPGVTQRQLNDFLREKAPRMWMDPVPTFDDASVVGVVLERGHSMGVNADRVAHACDFEVVTATGLRFSTGGKSKPGAKVAGLDRWGLGPSLDGLFAQSSFGIVTQLTLWLMPAPEDVLVLTWSLETQDAFTRVLDTLRPLRLDGTIRNGPRLFNEHRLIQTFTRYPWELMKGETPLSEAAVGKLRAEFGLPLWHGSVAFYGSREQIEADHARVDRALTGLGVTTHALRRDELSKPAPSEKNGIARFNRWLVSNMCGVAGPMPQRPRWRKKGPAATATTDWTTEGAGIIWCPVSTPFRGRDAMECVAIYRDTFAEHGFEPDMSVSAIRERTLEVNVSIVFDRDVPGEDEKALRCVRDVMNRQQKAGYYSHRLGIPNMHMMEHLTPDHQATLRAISEALDPKQILAPGRYVLNSNNSHQG